MLKNILKILGTAAAGGGVGAAAGTALDIDWGQIVGVALSAALSAVIGLYVKPPASTPPR